MFNSFVKLPEGITYNPFMDELTHLGDILGLFSSYEVAYSSKSQVTNDTSGDDDSSSERQS